MTKYSYVSTGVFQKRLMTEQWPSWERPSVDLDRIFQQAGILDEIRGRQQVCTGKTPSEKVFLEAAIVFQHQTPASPAFQYWYDIRSSRGTSKSLDLDAEKSSLLGWLTTSLAHQQTLLDSPGQCNKMPFMLYPHSLGSDPPGNCLIHSLIPKGTSPANWSRISWEMANCESTSNLRLPWLSLLPWLQWGGMSDWGFESKRKNCCLFPRQWAHFSVSTDLS